jgi:hypothetical protein
VQQSKASCESPDLGQITGRRLAAAIAGLFGRHIDRRALATLLTVAVAGLLSVWIVAFQTSTYEARYVYVGLSAIAALVALGLERWKLPVRFIRPAMGHIGTVVAIEQNVLAVHWSWCSVAEAGGRSVPGAAIQYSGAA